MLAALGFSTIGLFLLLTMTKRVSVLVALVLLPVLAALIGGFGGRSGRDDPRRAVHRWPPPAS